MIPMPPRTTAICPVCGQRIGLQLTGALYPHFPPKRNVLGAPKVDLCLGRDGVPSPAPPPLRRLP